VRLSSHWRTERVVNLGRAESEVFIL